ncbi:hypothetical protein HHL17_03465 [Chitinophaga sp. G-6-1-13]|uniref:Uncharacterized protein n=1 Tax=Chitinophaga fulva TaxID=2728842 RepID=A0A848GFN9_9BACT|nr:hypothetical protein [Chitinophaga fulva]NML36249.1 hypothetical protein [Chitinophaga fulva]
MARRLNKKNSQYGHPAAKTISLKCCTTSKVYRKVELFLISPINIGQNTPLGKRELSGGSFLQASGEKLRKSGFVFSHLVIWIFKYFK